MFYKRIAILTGVCAVVAAVFGASPRAWNNEAREPIHHTFSGDKTLDVDVVLGSIDVVGDNGTTIRAEGEKIIRAVDQAEIERAKKDVALDINEKDGVAQLCENGPFRGFHIYYDGRDYEVTYNFTIHVPRDMELRLRTVNGEIRLEQTNGKFDIHNVNGGIAMTGVAGFGTVKTVNGKTTVTFRENPKSATDFESVNGILDVTFQPDLTADLHFKTVNGAAYTDFNTTALASSGPLPQRRNGGFGGSARVGSGGPALNFETVNGDIRIRKQGN